MLRTTALLLSIRSARAFATRSSALPLRCRALAAASRADDNGGRTRGRRRRRPSTNQRTPQAGDPPSAAAQKRSAVPLGAVVDVVQKEDQPTGKKTRGIVARHLTRAAQHPRGIKGYALVARFLSQLERPHLFTKFLSQNVDDEVLPSLNESDLDDMAIPSDSDAARAILGGIRDAEFIAGLRV